MADHPAKFSTGMIPLFRKILDLEIARPHPGYAPRVLDPFAGTGRIHELRPDYRTFGIELEPEWAYMSPHTLVGSALDISQGWTETMDAIVTSPTYGNRMADHHNAKDKSKRRTYKHTLGRNPSPGSSSVMQWGPAYREFHELAWREAIRVLRPGGVFILNISDHIRKGEVVHVSGWHYEMLVSLELRPLYKEMHALRTKRMKFGANGDVRQPFEYILTFRKPNL